MFLNSIQHLSLGNDVTSSDKNIVIAWLKHFFISKFFAQHIQCVSRTHICNRIETKAEFYQFKQLPDRLSTWQKFHIGSKNFTQVCRF